MTLQRSASWAIVLSLLAALPGGAYTIVKKDGKRLEVKAAPEYRDGKAHYVLPGGLAGSMPEESVDKRATVTANAAPTKAPSDTGKKSSFTNADLPRRDGEVPDAGVPEAVAPAADEDWIKKHDEEMARLDAERRGEAPAPKGAAPKGGTPDGAAPGAAPKGAAAPAFSGPGAEGADDDGDHRAAAAEMAEGEKRRRQHQEEEAADEDAGAGGDRTAPPTRETPAPTSPPEDESDEEKEERLRAKSAELEKRLADLDRFISGGGGNAATVNERLRVADELSQVQSELGTDEE